MQRLRPKWLAKRPAPKQPTNWPRLHMLAEKKIVEYDTVLKFNNFTATQILREIKFYKFKNCNFGHFGGPQFYF